jgi:HD-GYP domain-containing protein (c-di-GMP phosphodiesterase class II)
VLDGVRSHHERVDGTGYPDGLADADIPLSPRIIAVADAYDAITTSRPYRAGLPPERARAEVRAGAGSQFCPRVVAAFESLFASGRFRLEIADQLLLAVMDPDLVL